MGFLDNIFKDDKKKTTGGNTNKNPLANVFGNKQTFKGAGQSLGGSKPGTVIPVALADPGPLGVRVEKRPNSEGTAIVHSVVEGSQADTAGLKRGDILCFAGSNGQDEMMYDMFLDMAKSTQRPIHLEIRRISTSLDKKNITSTASNNSADAEARRKAVIAAAEAREKAHKAKSKPIRQITKSTLAREQQQQQQQEQQEVSKEPLSEESRQAAQAAKQSEAKVAAQLGYNPYETSRATAGQARTATTAVQHGTINLGSAGDHLPTVAPPREATSSVSQEEEFPPSPEFEEAHAAMISGNSSDAVKSSLSIIRKLIINATTKGQTPGDDSAKFRKVRLANAKIKAAIVDLVGAVELMLACGFRLEEQDGESVLTYPADCPGPDWLSSALKQLET